MDVYPYKLHYIIWFYSVITLSASIDSVKSMYIWLIPIKLKETCIVAENY